MRALLAACLALTLAVPAAAADGSEEDKNALRAMARAFEQAVAQRELQRFQAALAPEFVGTLVTDEVVNRDSMRTFWDWVWGLIGPKGQWQVKIEPEDTIFLGDVAVARGLARDHIVTEKGGEYRFNWHWTLVLQKREGQWKALAGHGSMNPLDNPFLQMERTWTKALFGGGGLLAGLVVGAGSALLVRRRRSA